MNAFQSPNLWHFMSFAKRLHALRKEQGLTQKALAEKASTHLTQIQRYESGETQPNLDALKKLALALHVTTDTLVFDEDERGPASDDLKLAFEAVSQFDDEDKEIAKRVIQGLIMQHQNKQLAAGLGTRKTAAAS